MPIPQARVDLYLAGATVKRKLTINPGLTGAVPIESVGGLHDGAFVRIGADGPVLSVVSVDGSSQVTLSNQTGLVVTIPSGSRLLVVTGRPTAYQDAFGTVSLGSTVTADSGGRAQVYLPEGDYDYILTDPVDEAVIAGAPATPGTLAGSADTFSWPHTITSGQTLLLVAVSWQESTGIETLDSVTYNGTPMTSLGGSNFTSVYYLIDPATGTHDVVVTFSGSNPKAAVGDSIGLSNANSVSPLSPPREVTGPGTTGGVSYAGALPKAWAFTVLGVNTVPGTTTVTLNAGPTSLWNQSIGTIGASTRTQAAGASRATDGDAVPITWSITPSRAWGAVAVEVLPLWYALGTAATASSACSSEFGVLATMFASLQAAIDSLPNSGGTVHVPHGTYRQGRGLVIERPNVTLLGEGSNTVITPDDPANGPIDLLTISAAQTRIVGIRFDGAATTRDLDDGTCCIVMNGLGISGRLVQHCFFENVVVTGASRYGLWMRGVILFTAINCEFVENLGTGVRIQGTETEDGSTTTLRFYDCAFSSNGALGADVGDDEVEAPGVVGLTFMGCGFQGNQGQGVASTANIGLAINANESARIDVLSCYFEGPAVAGSQFVRLKNCSAATVDSCWFDGGADSDARPVRAADFINCEWGRFSSNAINHVTSEIVHFDLGCVEAIEYGNRDLSPPASGVDRIVFDNPRAIGMSRRALGIPAHAGTGTRPGLSDGITPGSLIWVIQPATGDKNLQVWDGTGWRGIDIV